MNKFLVDDWKVVLKRSLSVLMAAISVVFGVLEQNHDAVVELLTLLKPHIEAGTFGTLSTVFAALAIVGRVKRQPSMHQKELT